MVFLNGLQFLFKAGIFSRQVALQAPNADTSRWTMSSTKKKPLGMAE